MKLAFRFSLRTMLLAVTIWSVLLMGFIQWGMVEALDLALLVVGPLVLVAHLHHVIVVQRRVVSGALAILHVLATTAAVVVAYWMTRIGGDWMATLAWAIAWVFMFPLALIHHFVCRYCGWHSGLAQPGTFLLVVVLNTLLWSHIWWWRKTKHSANVTETQRDA